MAVELSKRARELLSGPSFGNLATIMPDGAPHVAPVWVDLVDGHILVNTAEGRQKLRNVRRDPRVALSVTNPKDPYEMVSLCGRVVETTSDGADDHIDHLAKKYLGVDKYPYRQPGERRVILKIEPERQLGRR